jgi:cytochrome c-type biogenesis protein
METAVILGAYAAGVLSCLSTCMAPVGAVFLALITGTARADRPADASGTVAAGSGSPLYLIAFTVGLSVMFFILSFPGTPVGGWVYLGRGLFRIAGGGLLVLYGLNLVWDKTASIFGRIGPAGPGAAFLMGLGLAAGWNPCSGITLNSAVLYAALDGHLVQGALILAAFAAGQASLLILAGLTWHFFIDLPFPKGEGRDRLADAAGLVMMIVGIFSIFGKIGLLTPGWAMVFNV